jgi:hypothetical protein
MVTCVLFSPAEYLLYDKSAAALLLSYRASSNYGVKRTEGIALTEEEIDGLVEKIGDVEERPLTESELEILKCIRLTHPEAKHAVLAADPKTSSNPMKELSNVGKQKLAPKFAGFLSRIFETALPENEDKKELKRFLQLNYKNMQALQDSIRGDKNMMQYLEKGVESGKLDVAGLTAMTEFLKKDPSWLKTLDLSSVGNVTMHVPLEKIGELDGMGDADKEVLRRAMIKLLGQNGLHELKVDVDAPSNEVERVKDDMEELRKNMKKFSGEEKKKAEKQLEQKSDRLKELAERVIEISGPWGEMAKFKKLFDIKPSDNLKHL